MCRVVCEYDAWHSYFADPVRIQRSFVCLIVKSQNMLLYGVIPANRTTIFDLASVFLTTHTWMSQQRSQRVPSKRDLSFYNKRPILKVFRTPSQRVSKAYYKKLAKSMMHFLFAGMTLNARVRCSGCLNQSRSLVLRKKVFYQDKYTTSMSALVVESV